MVGAIVSVMILSITSGAAYMPSLAKAAAQCLAGAFIACGIGRNDLKNISKLRGPLLVLLLSLLLVNLVLGFLIWLCSPLDMLTAMLCAVPGGMSDTPIIAADLGADAGKVAILQFVRMSAGIGIFPSLILLLSRDEAGSSAEVAQSTQENGIPPRASISHDPCRGFLLRRLGKAVRHPGGHAGVCHVRRDRP